MRKAKKKTATSAASTPKPVSQPKKAENNVALFAKLARQKPATRRGR